MIKNYLKIALRNLRKNKSSSFINITGLAIGMAVAMMIGLWIYDELSFDKHHKNYDRIAQVMQSQSINGEIGTWPTMPFPTGATIRNKYGSDFKYVLMSTWDFRLILATGNKSLSKVGKYMEPQAPEMLNLQMLKGSRNALFDKSSIIISQSTAKTYFGNDDPMGKGMKINSKIDVKIAGVYKDLPANSTFGEVNFFAPWKLYLASEPWIEQMQNPWGNNSFLVFVQIADNADMKQVSEKIRNVKKDNVQKEEAKYNPKIFLHPMSKWHLYSDFKNGVNTGGRIQFIWLFGIIGVFVLILACINFMNLSTARSEKRAKEVGIRKAIGSLRRQLIVQFYSESILVSLFAFVLSLVVVQLMLPFFNDVAGKQVSIPWSNPLFWVAGICFSLITSLIAGSYPALYLSSFQSVKVLKGTFRVGRFAAIPRKVLVVLQFSVSIILIIGTIIVFRQVQYAKDRPVGYTRDGVVSTQMLTPDIDKHFEAVRSELKNAGAIVEIAEAAAPLTNVWQTNGDITWEGKDPNLAVDFPNTAVSYDFGKTVGWQFKGGRDFSREYATDSFAFVLNESAVRFMGLKNPVGQNLKWDGHPVRIIGVIKDMLVESPYQPVRPSLYYLIRDDKNIAVMKLNPAISPRQALGTIEKVFKKYAPNDAFDFKFADEDYNRKFGDEERIGKLASAFAILAIFISCLGLFGMASFVVEQRTKEIGVRKVLGASVINVWRLLSKDFIVLVIISCLIAIPLAWYFLHQWLQNYDYRTNISWWIFAVTGIGALLITLLTVSFQAIKAALMNPVKSLRTE